MATKEEIKDQVIEATKTVNDPELGIDIWHLGLIYEVDVDDDFNVKVIYTLTTIGCMIGPWIEEQIKEATANIEGMGTLTAEMVMDPAWTPERMHPLAKSALGVV